MDKYEEVLSILTMKVDLGRDIEANIQDVVGLQHFETIREALEKARKFDQLVEARKCSTCKNVETHACRTIGCPDYGIEAVDVEGFKKEYPHVPDVNRKYAEVIGWNACIDHLVASGYRFMRTPANLTREGE